MKIHCLTYILYIWMLFTAIRLSLNTSSPYTSTDNSAVTQYQQSLHQHRQFSCHSVPAVLTPVHKIQLSLGPSSPYISTNNSAVTQSQQSLKQHRQSSCHSVPAVLTPVQTIQLSLSTSRP